MWFKFKQKKKATIGVGRYVEITECKYNESFKGYKNPKMRIDCNDSGLQVQVSDWLSIAKINLSRKDALELAESIVDHFGGE